MIKLRSKTKGLNFTLGLMAALLFVFAIAPPGMATETGESEGKQITLSSAIDIALKQNEGLKKADKEVEKKEEWRDYRASKLDFIPTTAPGTALVEVPWAQMLSSDLEWRMSKKALTAKEDQIVLDTCKKYWAVLQAQEKVKAAEAGVVCSLKQLQSTRVAYQVGISLVPAMSPEQALKAAEAQYAGAQATLAEAKNKLDSAYNSLNQLLGMQANERYILTDMVEYQPLAVVNLDAEVSRVVDASPDIWNAEQMVTLQGFLEDMMFYTGEYRPYQARKIEVEQAELDAASAKKAVEQGTRSIYYTIRNMEEGYNGLLQAVKVAEENLRVTKLKFDLGMATAAEVASDEKKLADAHLAAFDMVYNHAYMKLAFQKPWAYSKE